MTLCGDPRHPLRGSAWSVCRSSGLSTISDLPARPSAESAFKTRGFLRFLRTCRSALAVAPCGFPAHDMAFGSCLVVCAPAFAIPSRIRFPPGPRARAVSFRSSGWKNTTFKYESSTRSKLSQLRLEIRNFYLLRATC